MYKTISQIKKELLKILLTGFKSFFCLKVIRLQ